MSRKIVALLAGTAMLAAACGSGESILSAGNDPEPTATRAPVTTSTTGPSSEPANTSNPGDVTDTAVDGEQPRDSTPSSVAATTTTTPLDSLPPCPVAGLEAADGPIEITFWHGLTADNEEALITVTDAYNSSQGGVLVRLQNQGGYGETIDKYVQSGQANRPDMVMFPDYVMKRIVDSDSIIPADACIHTSGMDTSEFQPATLAAYRTEGVQWAMPFNVSNPVLYYNRSMFEAAGLDPDQPPQNFDDLRSYSQQLVDSGVAAFGISIDSGTDSGGGWFIEQWLANAGELYADNANGRLQPATRVLYDGPAGVSLLTFLQRMVADGLAVNVGDNPGGTDQYLKLADRDTPAAMTIGSSSSLGTIINVVDGGLIPGITGADIGVGPLPGPGERPTALVGGAALYVVADHGDEKAAAAWDFISYLVSAEVQSEWATLTGYVPMRPDALEIEPAASVYRDDHRFRVAYDQLVNSPEQPALQGPVLGPQREVRAVTARAVAAILDGADVATTLAAAAAQSNALVADYNARN